jgi:serine/threonine-protein kinase
MGLVVRATDQVLGRDVAVKLLADNLAADPDARERFLREARAAARIVDPHVVGVYDVGDEAGRPYIVMELVDGPSLADLLRVRGRLDPDEVAQAAVDALTGLSRAHDVGLLHRDVKPGNLLRTPDGTVKVTDFGVAKAADAPGLTGAGLVIGTRSYLAPERRRGLPATPATDLYALGVTLTQLLMGQWPDPATMPEVKDHTPAGLRRVLPSLLAHDPQDRPASAAEALTIITGRPPVDRHQSARTHHPMGPRSASSAPSGDTTAELPSSSPPAPSDAPPPGKRHRRALSRVAFTAAAAALAVVIALGQTPMAEPGDGDGSVGPAGGVPRVDDDPARTARHLAEWIREYGER